MTSDLVKKLKEKAAELEEDPVGLVLASELAGEDELAWLVEVMALPHWFDVSMLNNMLPDGMKPDRDMDFVGQQFDYVQALLDLSFVGGLPQAAGLEKAQPRFEIDKAYRARLLKRWQVPERREELVAFSRRFYNYFRRLQEHADDFQAPILEREKLYHNFITNESEAMARFRTLYEEGESAYRLGLCQALVNLAREQEEFFQEESTTTWLIYYQGRLNLMLGNLQSAREQFEKTLAQPHVRRWLRGSAQAGLGDVSRAEGRWSQAMHEYEQSLHVLLGVRRNLLADLDKMNIRQQITESGEQLEVARILTRMADLALAMGQPAISLFPTSLAREEEKKLSLTNVVQQRLLAFAEQLYKQVLKILEPTSEDTSEAPIRPLQNNLIWDIRYGLATVLLFKPGDHTAEARASYEKLLTDKTNQYERGELMLALGDCSLASLDSDRIDDAVKQYEKAADTLKDTWDRPMRAKALHRLGRAKALQAKWQPALSYLTESRQIYSQIGNEREEEKVQETLRELSSYKGAPDKIRQRIKDDMAGWSAHYFAYSASFPVLNRVKQVWWPIFAVATVPLTAIYFYIVRFVGIWFLGLFGAEHLLSSWWANVIFIMFCWFIALFVLDMSVTFRRRVGRLLPLNIFWGSQPDFITVDDAKFTHVNSAGHVRTMTWDEVTELRRGYSDDWVVGEASLTASGAPGGRMLLFAPNGVLTVDAGINSYLDLDKLVHERVQEPVQNYKKFESTFRGTALIILFVSVFFLVIFGFPIIFILTSSDPSWWMILLKVVAGAFLALVVLGFGVVLVDAFRMRRFLYPRHLPGPPPPVDRTMLGRRYTEQERKSL